MGKIEKMTVEQEKMLPIYLDKWLKAGRSTERLDRDKSKEAVNFLYQNAGKKNPDNYFFFDSPLQCQLAVNVINGLKNEANLWANLEDNLGANLWANLRANLGDNLEANLGANLRANLRGNLWANLGANLRGNLGANLRDKLGANLRDNLRDNLWDNLGVNLGDNLEVNLGANLRAKLGANLEANLGANLRANLGDNLWANLGDKLGANLGVFNYQVDLNYQRPWVGNYDFILNVLFPGRIKEFHAYNNFCKHLDNLFIVIPFDNVAFISERPIEININSDGRLHSDCGPSMLFSDGYALYNLNGVAVTKDIAMLTPGEITKDIILKQENADIRREIVRKLTPEKLIEVLDAKILDSSCGYELLGIDLGDDRTRPFLKMKNPSIDAVHVEGVSPECKTVQDAIVFRNTLGSFSLPKTLDGKEMFSEKVGSYHQQGDCLLFPVKDIPTGATICQHKIAGDGLVRHIAVNADIYETNGARFVDAFEGCRIDHPEHESTLLDHGIYEVRKVMEYDHWKEESREVID